MRSVNKLDVKLGRPVVAQDRPLLSGMSLTMAWVENVRLAARTLWANRLRSLLTMLGLIIGIGSVILVIALGVGAQQFVRAQFEGLGTNVVAIFDGGPRTRGQQPLTVADVEALRTQVSAVKQAVPLAYGNARVVRGSHDAQTQLAGAPASLIQTLKITFLKGRYFTAQEIDGRARVVILGEGTSKKLFEFDDPIGQTVLVNDQVLTVVGVTKSSFFGTWVDLDRGILVPLPLALENFVPSNSPLGQRIGAAILEAKPEANVDAVTFEAKNLLRQRHQVTDQEDFTLGNIQEQIDIFNNIALGVTIVLGLTAAISLVVSGIGIMNIMLVSVTERTKEIGLRKALGASEGVILTQFVIEAVLISMVGGIIGVALGGGLALAIAQVAPLKPIVTLWSVLLAVGVAAGTGLFFGVFPARQAARLDPIVALRSD
ncbi:ABC transporter permease [Anthocerotibacter panamensis]|uniref:ABC transporter permease n=1 Tax=Anthocerotibacter panamensis TaxID=2857077 RepID=UPI001FDA0000|nr:ABC transporter permease [Anthocerotibacter panamensis]